VASFAGAYYELPPVRSGPKPVQRPWPPIWVGGNSAAALTRAVALGDGLHLIDLSPEEIAPIGAQFAARLHAAQRERSTLTLRLRSSVTVGDGEPGWRRRRCPRRASRPAGSTRRPGVPGSGSRKNAAGGGDEREGSAVPIAAALIA
jgi:alkanesulfonate monooxygenase SsuD/methylene tetrahydromethanopterin reductase-like flavin-dependent oxidoreductase (luciferase family)